MFKNSMEIYDKIENYSLLHSQRIPKVEVIDYPKNSWWGVNNSDADEMSNFPILKQMFVSEDKIERYWVNQCWDALEAKFNDSPLNHLEYVKRLEEEADIKKTIGEKLNTNMFSYPVTLQHYVDLFWECGSTVGAGRGSSCSGLNHYLLGITQLDPIKYGLQFWRYLNKERIELGDIDIDLCPSKRPLILKRIRQERGQKFNQDIDELSRENLGCTLIATFGTEKTRSTILTACRGYRSEEFPNGIDVDIAQYLSSLIPSERGFLWELDDVIYGNPDKDRKPIALFINEVEKYPGLLDIMKGIQGVVNKRSSHASGVIMFDEDPYEAGCFMRTPKGEIITQYDLHMDEAVGLTKYDMLLTDVQDKIVETIRLLQEDGEIESNLSLREIYNKYLHPEVIDLNNDKIWDALKNNSVLDIFQFNSQVGAQAAKKIEPRTIQEMADSNGLMRLMTAEKGRESPIDKYVRFKNNISLWYQEMDEAGLTKEEQKVIEPYFKPSYGVPPSQEQLMQMLMDENICGFTLAEANTARKVVGKKQISKIPELKEKILERAKSKNLGKYIWEAGVGPQMGYSFSVIHALAYSFIGVQTILLATQWNPIYWNTACLIINSASQENEDEDKNTDDTSKNTDYAKIARAIGDITSRGIKVYPININESSYSFKPDVKNNQILFGLKGLNRVGEPLISSIIANRPYSGIIDFMNRCSLNKPAIISLIKAGAFDDLDSSWAKQINPQEPRKAILGYYLYLASEPKSKLTLQNFNSLVQRGLIPDDLKYEQTIFSFNKYLKEKTKWKEYYVLGNNAYHFYEQNFDVEKLNIINGCPCLPQKEWDKMYHQKMDVARDYLKEHQKEMLKSLNQKLFEETWHNYAEGSISAWEMESMCFYYHEHELAHVNYSKYGIKDFFSLPEEPEVDYMFKRSGRQIPVYKLTRIAGTVIGKNDARSSIAVLTTNGVVNVKFTKDYFAMYNRQISQIQDDGSKKVLEKGWFVRGTKVVVQGYRREDTFVAKKYSKSAGHQLYKITLVKKNGDLVLENERAISDKEDD